MQNEPFGDPYAILGVPRSVTPDELKRAYRKLSLVWHPDRHAGASQPEQAQAEQHFKLVNAAYVAIGELLRAPAAHAPVAQQAEMQRQSDQRVVKQSDTRAEAIRSVVSSAALRVVPNLPRHAFRRVIGVAEHVLLDTIAVGDRAFTAGFDAALRDAMFIEGMDENLLADALNVLDAAADELQWRGKGADPQTWQDLLRPLERARGRVAEPASRKEPGTIRGAPTFSLATLLRQEPLPMVGQSALAVLAILLLLPVAPLSALPRLALLALDIAALVYLTFGQPRA